MDDQHCYQVPDDVEGKQPALSHQKPGRKRKVSKVQRFLNELPDGIRFIGRPEQFSEAYLL